MEFIMRAELPEIEKILNRLGLEEHGRVQMQIDQSFLDYCGDYLPFDNGVLKDSGYRATEIR